MPRAPSVHWKNGQVRFPGFYLICGIITFSHALVSGRQSFNKMIDIVSGEIELKLTTQYHGLSDFFLVTELFKVNVY